MSISKSVIEKINKTLVDKMEAGVKPWRKCWKSVTFDGMDFSSPVNLVSKTRYRGINWILLSMHSGSLPVFLTFNQVKKLGATVKAGSGSLPVIYFQKVSRESENEQGEMDKRTYPMLKYYNVFNIEDTTVDMQKLGMKLSSGNLIHPIANIEKPINDYLEKEKITFRKSLSDNYYNLTTDSIHMVDLRFFDSSEEYYSTLIHEAIHSTGHESRLNRLKLTRKREEYAFEELIAEIGASYLASHFDISNDDLTDNAAAYLKSWLGALKDDPYFFYQAAKQAQAAADFIINEKEEHREE
jgi:antirestriction protein ArdC